MPVRRLDDILGVTFLEAASNVALFRVRDEFSPLQMLS